jgi:hypothetical protein
LSRNAYDNRPVAEWAQRNITQPVLVRRLFFLIGLLALALGAKDPSTRFGPFVFGFLLMFPCGLIALLGAYVRRSFARSLDAHGANGSFGVKFQWNKLYYVDHVSKYLRGSRRIEDNQLELVFEGGKLIIPPMIHKRDEIWALINRLPVEVRDDGKPREMTPEQKLMAFLNSQK